MRPFPISILLLVLLLLSAVTCFAQTPPKIFVYCNTSSVKCTPFYLQQNMPGCNFITDSVGADVLIFISVKSTPDSINVCMQCTGKNVLEGKKDSSHFNVAGNQNFDSTQAKLLLLIQQSLAYLFHHSAWENVFAIQSSGHENITVAPPNDKWNNWNFIPGFSGKTENESNSGFLEINANFTARRITNNKKFILNLQHKTASNSYTYDNEKVAAQVTSIHALPLYVYSLTKHWSTGVTGEYQKDEYKNITASYRLAPVVEYNFFPYTTDAVNQLRLVYQAGVLNYHYADTTIHNKTKETRAYQRAALISDISRNWGSLRTSVQANAFLNNIKQNRITLNSLLSVNLFKGLAFNIQGQFEWVNDQVSLLKNPLDDDIYWLDGQQLPTRFYMWADFGLTYSFGSILGNTVNPRMGQVDEIN